MNRKNVRIEAVVFAILLLGTFFFVPVSSMDNNIEFAEESLLTSYRSVNKITKNEGIDLGPFVLDRKYIIDQESEPLNRNEYDDAGYRSDAGDSFTRSDALYPGEIVDDTPGRGVTGKLSSSDDEDWYFFSVSDGQGMDITITPASGYNFDLALYDESETLKASSSSGGAGVAESISFTAEYTGYYYFQIEFINGAGEGSYTIDITLDPQNDANSGDDAGDTFAQAVLITPGDYSGYLDKDDPYDYYKFEVSTGDGIHFDLEMRNIAYLTDFDILLYDENEELVHYQKYYYDDELLYPVPSGVSNEMWRVRIEIFPGWVDIPTPTEWKYYAYGSGAYNLEFSIESSAPAPPDPIPQPEITPIAKTYTINNDPDSNNDEYGYLASIPACNYLEGGDRYLAPIVYDGDETETSYYDSDDRGVVDDTTGYLLDDWNEYLASHEKVATEYTVPADPIEAASEIATNNWGSSDLAVIALDGSDYEDEVKEVLSKTKTLKREVNEEMFFSDSPDAGEEFGVTKFIWPKWCAMIVSVEDISIQSHSSSGAALTQIFPQFMHQASKDWPVPYDGTGDAYLYYPLTQPGIWSASTGVGMNYYDTITLQKIAGHRHKIKIKNADADSVLKVTVATDSLSDLQVFLVDPDGHIRAPDMPQWIGPILPIHEWYGFENPTVNPWSNWEPEDHLDCSAEVLHPEAGKWTAIVVPRYAENSGSTKYTITAELRKTNPKRADAAISASNAAVIASLEHAPLLYVTEDAIPSETQSALSSLGVSNVIIVDRGDNIQQSVKDDLPSTTEDLTTMQDIIDYIKDYDASENYITITSIKSGDGYFAPAAMLAAYHGSPVLRIGEAPDNPAGIADRIETWRLWSGTYYHGSRAPGHLPGDDEPIEDMTQFQLGIKLFRYFMGMTEDHPPLGWDANLRWKGALHDALHDWVDSYGLDIGGKEAYVMVAPRKDIYIPAHSVMMGNNSYGGHIPGITPAYISSIVVRNILYPAVIFGNENRHVTTTDFMNYPDGGTWTVNNGDLYGVISTRVIKHFFSSHGRTYEGHSLWDAHLERMNLGASAFYYSGHGTGGSGQSHQYYQTEHCRYPEQIWWDSWRGYSYDTWKMPRKNGRVWYNPEPPELYDIIHYDHLDNLYDNLGSCAVFYMSCSTAEQFGPMVSLDHGAVLWYGNSGTGVCPQADLQDDWFFEDTMLYGEGIGYAYSKTVWLHQRDYTTRDPTAMYGPSSRGGYPNTTVQCIYGDPNLVIFSPEWTSPTPIDA
jgi:hypothetical protein